MGREKMSRPSQTLKTVHDIRSSSVRCLSYTLLEPCTGVPRKNVMAHLIDAMWEEFGEELEEVVNDADSLPDSEDASVPSNAYDADDVAPAQNARDTGAF